MKIKLADGKVRTIQHMSATTFWTPDGKPMSADQFISHLFGELLPDLFKDEEELREIWSDPETRRGLMEGLVEKGYSVEQIKEIGQLAQAENSDLYDVLAYIAFANVPISRAERVESHKEEIFSNYDERQQEFLRFVIDQYVDQGVSELDPEKLPQLIELKYDAIGDAVSELGSVSEIRDVFVGFQKHLY